MATVRANRPGLFNFDFIGEFTRNSAHVFFQRSMKPEDRYFQHGSPVCGRSFPKDYARAQLYAEPRALLQLGEHAATPLLSTTEARGLWSRL